MIDLSAYRGRRVAVLGLGRSGLSAACALRAGGAELLAWDDKPAGREAAAAAGLPLADLASADWASIAMLVLSPGIPHSHPQPHPVALRARAAGCEILCDVELLWRARRQARFVGITGTNGKSTTTALTAHILATAGRAAAAGGNIGRAALSLEPLDGDGTYVLELSSYQLELLPETVFDIAALLNVSPDHLDRHGGLHPYVAAKRRIFAGQEGDQVAVIGIDDPHSAHVRAALAAAGRQRVLPVSATRPAPGGVSAAGGRLIDDLEGGAEEVLDLTGIATLPGAHNWQNAAAAYAVARAAGLAPEEIAAGLRLYPGLPHRQELVATVGGVRYVNDSKATNADSAARALASYDGNVYWIAGGLPKEGGIAPLAPLFPRVRHAFLIGAAAADFARTLDGRAAWTRCGDLATALALAHEMAQAERRPGAVVLLSPACASFDQWPNFEARGDAFRSMAQALAANAERAA